MGLNHNDGVCSSLFQQIDYCNNEEHAMIKIYYIVLGTSCLMVAPPPSLHYLLSVSLLFTSVLS